MSCTHRPKGLPCVPSLGRINTTAHGLVWAWTCIYCCRRTG